MAYLVIYQNGKPAARMRLEGPTLIGRSGECGLVLPDATVSRKHCTIERRALGWVITDLDSSNGTAVAGVDVAQLGLADGDEIQVGGFLLRFYEGNPIQRRPRGPEEAIAPHRNYVDENAETKLIDGQRLPPRPMPRATSSSGT